MAWIAKYHREDGSVRYRVCWREGRSQRSETAGPRRRDAERLKVEIERRLALGDLITARPEPFGDLLDAFLDRHALRVSPSTIKRYREAAVRLEPIRHLAIDRLGPGDVDDLVLEVARTASRQSEIARQLIHQVLRDAQLRGHRFDERILAVRKARSKPRERNFLTWEQVQHLASCTPGPYDRMVLVTALTGLRQGEVFALRAASFDAAGRTLVVTRKVIDGEEGGPKSAAGRRRIHLCTSAQRLLREQIADTGPNELGLVWTAPNGGMCRHDNFMERIYRPAVRRSGLPRVSFHDLRHTYAALMVAAGAHPKLLQAQMGHASIRITLDTYGHLYPDVGAEVAERLEAVLSDALRGEPAAEGLHERGPA